MNCSTEVGSGCNAAQPRLDHLNQGEVLYLCIPGYATLYPGNTFVKNQAFYLTPPLIPVEHCGLDAASGTRFFWDMNELLMPTHLKN